MVTHTLEQYLNSIVESGVLLKDVKKKAINNGSETILKNLKYRSFLQRV